MDDQLYPLLVVVEQLQVFVDDDQQNGHGFQIPAGQPQRYHFVLPTANHVFLPGHRIMVQIQSSCFPLYDRNPQTYVENIFFSKPADYAKVTQSVFRSAAEPSAVWLPVTP